MSWSSRVGAGLVASLVVATTFGAVATASVHSAEPMPDIARSPTYAADTAPALIDAVASAAPQGGCSPPVANGFIGGWALDWNFGSAPSGTLVTLQPTTRLASAAAQARPGSATGTVKGLAIVADSVKGQSQLYTFIRSGDRWAFNNSSAACLPADTTTALSFLTGGGAKVVPATGATGATGAVATADGCQQVLVVGVRGSGEPAGFGETIQKTVNAFNSVYGSATDVVPLDYAAAGIGPVWLVKPWRAGDFASSVRDGITELDLLLHTRAADCPTQRIVLFGYSQGALVVNRELIALQRADYALLQRVAAVGLIADPARLGSSRFNRSGAGFASRKLNGIAVSVKKAAKRDLPTVLSGRAQSVCLDDDLVCAYRAGRSVVNPGATHAVYKSSLAAEVGTWAATKLLGASSAAAATTTTPPAAGASGPQGYSFKVKIGQGWTYAYTLRFTPASGYAKDIRNSPPGKAGISLERSATFSVSGSSADVGRNAPDVPTVSKVTVWFNRTADASIGGSDIPTCTAALAGTSDAERLGVNPITSSVPPHPPFTTGCYAYSPPRVGERTGGLEDTPEVDAVVSEMNTIPPVFIVAQIMNSSAGNGCSVMLFPDGTSAAYDGCTSVP
jgi:hypothetical protein